MGDIMPVFASEYLQVLNKYYSKSKLNHEHASLFIYQLISEKQLALGAMYVNLFFKTLPNLLERVKQEHKLSKPKKRKKYDFLSCPNAYQYPLNANGISSHIYSPTNVSHYVPRVYNPEASGRKTALVEK